jgi:hypothetical protein
MSSMFLTRPEPWNMKEDMHWNVRHIKITWIKSITTNVDQAKWRDYRIYGVYFPVQLTDLAP